MTRTEIERAKLSELERHNREQERIGKIGNVVGAVGSVASMASGFGKATSGIAALRKASLGGKR